MENCLFCKIINKEIPSTIVYEDEEILAFKDINPIAPVHILVIPKKHFNDISEVSEKDSDIIAKIHLGKINKIINKELPEAKKETLLVLDGTTGQNAIMQVKAFKETVDITGLILTKLDGTAKGGVVIGIVAENKIPVKFIGVGEQIDDMEKFNAKDFINAII